MRGQLLKRLPKIKKKENISKEKVMVLVDDNKKSIVENSPNSILIHPFTGDQKDNTLVQVFEQLVMFYQEKVD